MIPAYLMKEAIREAIRGHQRPSMAIRAHQSSSELIRGHQSSSEAIGAPLPWLPRAQIREAIRAHQRPSAHPSRGCRAPKKCSVRNRRPNLAEKIASRCRSIASFRAASSPDEPLASDEL